MVPSVANTTIKEEMNRQEEEVSVGCFTFLRHLWRRLRRKKHRKPPKHVGIETQTQTQSNTHQEEIVKSMTVDKV